MTTSLEESLRIGFPQVYPHSMLKEEYNSTCKGYIVLRYFGIYCSTHFEDQLTLNIISLINVHYQSNNLFIQNAIENEFLFAIADNLGTQGLLNNLNKIPEELQMIYLKVLMQTMKNKNTDHD